MKRYVLIAAALALALPSAALAKGASSATVSGPGLNGTSTIPGVGEGDDGTPLGALASYGGYFPQMFGQAPDPTTRSAPRGDLGPRYTVKYTVSGPGGDSFVTQDVYPYAKTPVTYMSPGQRFWGVNHTHGGWFVAGPGLKATLVAAGLPESPPTASGGSFPWAWLAAGVLAVVVLLALVLSRRRIARFRMVRSTA